jgi:aryl-alcohol dehydrogenase-like predicted oxidoreductase
MDYGIANNNRQPDYFSVESIIAAAWEHGIREFDTAQAYGESENVLGRAMLSLGIAQEARVVSKVEPGINHLDAGALRSALQKTLARLGLTKIHGLMLHKEDLLELWNSGLGGTMNSFVASDLVGHVGISVYTPESALRAIKTEGIDIVQLPSNIFDRRFEDAGVFREAELRGTQVYIRSVYLQGLLLLKTLELPESMAFAKPVMQKLEAFSRKTGFSAKQLALGYAKSAYPRHKVVFGCETIKQLSENIELWKIELPEGIVLGLREEFQNIPEIIINPSLWT